MNALLPNAPGWFLALLNLSLQAVLLAGIVWTLTKLIGRWIGPGFRALLWFVVLARVLIPFAPPSPFSLQNLFVNEAPAPATAPPQNVRVQTGIPSSAAIPESNITVEMPEPEAPAKPFPTGLALAALWGVGAFGSILLLAARCWLIRRRLANSAGNPSIELLEALQECRAALGLRYPVRASVSNDVAAPALTGLLPARLIVPRDFGTGAFSAGQIRQILLHELAHVRLGHLWLHWLALAARALHWFNPVIHIAALRLRRECELAADAAVLTNATDAERRAYGEIILKALSYSTAPATALAMGMAEEAAGLKQRLHALAFPPRRTFGPLGITVVLLVAICGLTGAASRPKTPFEVLHRSRNRNTVSAPAQFSADLPADTGAAQLAFEVQDPGERANQLLLEGKPDEARAVLQRAVAENNLHVQGALANWITSTNNALAAPGVTTQLQKIAMASEATNANPNNVVVPAPTAATVTGILTNPQFRATLNTLENRKVAESLLNLNPTTVSVSGRQARISVEESQPAITGLSIQGSGGGTDATEAAARNPAITTKARAEINKKLTTIYLKQFSLPEEKELSEALRDLSTAIKSSDPGHRGLNLIISEAADKTTNAPVNVHVDQFRVKFDKPLENVTVRQALDFIVLAAKPPVASSSRASLQYSVEDYAIVFSRRAEEEKLYTRTFRLDPTTFKRGMEGVSSAANPAQLLISQGAAGGGNSLGNGATFIATTTNLSALQKQIREFFAAAGVDFPTNQIIGGGSPTPPQAQKAIFYNDRTGVLFVRASLRDLDVVESSLHAVNAQPPQVVFSVEIFEAPQQIAAKILSGLEPREILSTNEFLFATRGATNAPVLSGSQMLLKNFNEPVGATNRPVPGSEFLLTRAEKAKLSETLTTEPDIAKISMPSVTTLMGRQARISVEDAATVVTAKTLQTGSGAQLSFGTMVDVIPHLATAETYEYSEIVTFTDFLGYAEKSDKSDMPLPRFRVRQVANHVKLPYEGTQLLVLPIPETKSIPILGDIPLLGRLFRTEKSGSNTNTDRRVLIFITPEIIDPAGNRVNLKEK